MEKKYLFEGFEFTLKELRVIDGIKEKKYTIQNFLMFFEFNRINELIEAKMLGVVGKDEKDRDLYAFIFFNERTMSSSLTLLLIKISLDYQFGELSE